jgi:hypothetical protein
VTILPDTSDRYLKGLVRPRNTISVRDGDTVVYYQNLIPDLTFRWSPIAGAASYRLKIFGERSLSTPLLVKSATSTSIRLGPRLREGRYLWYVVAEDGSGKLVGSTRSRASRRLVIDYDNATPDIQIQFPPRRGTTVAVPTIEVVGVTIRGSTVLVNGEPAALDRAWRFRHGVALRPGDNEILVQVIDPRRVVSHYLRRVTRR